MNLTFINPTATDATTLGLSRTSSSNTDRYRRLYGRRRLFDRLMTWIVRICVILCVIPLISVVGYVAWRGIGAVNWAFLTRLPAPVGAVGGGMANAIVGSGIVVGMAALIGIPIGVLGGIYLAEYGRHNKLGRAVRFFADVMQGIPSIVVGIVAYALVVLPMQQFSAIAGSVALAMMLIPFVTRTTEEAVLAVSDDIREAGMALGQPRWRVIMSVVVSASRGPLVTGVMLAIARIAGETAPLLFTALNNRFWHSGLDQPISTLTVQVYTYAIAPFDDWNRQAWAGAFVLLTIVFMINVIVRTAARSRYVERS